MFGKNILKKSFYFSLLVQALTGIATLGGLSYSVPKQDKVLIDVLALETIVQIVEGIFYVYIIMSLKQIKTNKVTRRRYLDWVITTPMMLLSTIIYMEYEKEKTLNRTVKTGDFINNNKKNIASIFLFNMIMLISGYLGETKQIAKRISIPVGFAFLLASFNVVYTNYVGNIDVNKNLFTFMIMIWSLYGVAAMMPTINKNLSYNVLDIISKNFYGLFLFLKVRNISMQHSIFK